MSNSLDPDHTQHFVSPDLGPNFKKRKTVDTRGDSGLRQTCKVLKPFLNELQHEISNNVVCATSIGSDQPVWSEPLLVAWIFYECKATNGTSFGVSRFKRRLPSLVWVYTCQNATLLEISCHGSNEVCSCQRDTQLLVDWWLNNRFWMFWNLCMLGNFHAFVVVSWLFSKLTCSKKFFRNTIRVSNCLAPECFSRHRLGPNCLQRLSAAKKSHRYQG